VLPQLLALLPPWLPLPAGICLQEWIMPEGWRIYFVQIWQHTTQQKGSDIMFNKLLQNNKLECRLH
jgi:hypothetical protein